MDGQGRAGRDVTDLGVLALRECLIARVLRLGRELLVVEAVARLPLGAGGNLEGPHLVGRVDRREVEGERGEAVPLRRLWWAGEVAVPRLHLRTWEGSVEADLDDLVVRP